MNLQGTIIGVDFDGTVVTHEFPRVGKDVPGSVETLKKLIAAGAKLILWTMRSDLSGTLQSTDPTIHTGAADYLQHAVTWFKERGIELWGCQCNPEQKSWTASPKAYCHIYIDDAALGCPLITDQSFSDRPYVDWAEVDRILFPNNGKA